MESAFPVAVKVATLYSMTVDPASLREVILSMYLVAGVKSKIAYVPNGFTRLLVRIHSTLPL